MAAILELPRKVGALMMRAQIGSAPKAKQLRRLGIITRQEDLSRDELLALARVLEAFPDAKLDVAGELEARGYEV